MRRLSSVRSSDERGAVAVLTATFAVVTVVLAALVVDIGAMHDERRQLQNGADAAALGLAQYIAETCQSGAPPCPVPVLNGIAADLARGNALDDAADHVVEKIDYSKKLVTVRTTTRTSDGTILPYQFGQAFTGESGKTLKATATATWSGIGKAPVIPLTIGLCEWVNATSEGTVFGTPTRILFHGEEDCDGGKKKSGADLPGGFGWVTDNDADTGDCNVTPSVGGVVNVDTGRRGTPGSCDLTALLGKDVLVPIYDQKSGGGSVGTYVTYGFAQFHLTSYYFTNSDKGTSVPGQYPCANKLSCLGGYFVKFVAAGDVGGPTLGRQPSLFK
jgi:hypothetical protein